MTEKNKKDIFTFFVFDHTKKHKGSAIGYQCFYCGEIYVAGLYTIEGCLKINPREFFVVCSADQIIHYHCGYTLPLPILFFKFEESIAYKEALGEKFKEGSVAIIAKEHLVETYICCPTIH